MKKSDLQKHIFSTYIKMRYGVAIIAIIFPLLLSFGGKLQDLPRQDSMSAYYHANLSCHDGMALNKNESNCKDIDTGGNGIMRSYFVGLLFMLGGIFYLYKGYSKEENIALNLAGIFAIGVALIPMEWGEVKSSSFSMHGASAILMFLCLGYVILNCAPKTLTQMSDKNVIKKFKRKYRIIGALMVISPAVAWLFTVVFDQFKSYVFFAEVFGIWIFAIYWWVKSNELVISSAENRALTGVYK